MNARRDWSREWRFLIWSWSIDWNDDYWLVETVRHRFLGEEEIHHYSRFLWQMGAIASGICAVIAAILYALFVYWFHDDPDLDGSMMVLLGLVLLSTIAAAIGVIYFTYIPPKEYRSSRTR